MRKLAKNEFFSFLFFRVFVNDSKITIFLQYFFGDLIAKTRDYDFNDTNLPKRRALPRAAKKSLKKLLLILSPKQAKLRCFPTKLCPKSTSYSSLKGPQKMRPAGRSLAMPALDDITMKKIQFQII